MEVNDEGFIISTALMMLFVLESSVHAAQCMPQGNQSKGACETHWDARRDADINQCISLYEGQQQDPDASGPDRSRASYMVNGGCEERFDVVRSNSCAACP